MTLFPWVERFVLEHTPVNHAHAHTRHGESNCTCIAFCESVLPSDLSLNLEKGQCLESVNTAVPHPLPMTGQSRKGHMIIGNLGECLWNTATATSFPWISCTLSPLSSGTGPQLGCPCPCHYYLVLSVPKVSSLVTIYSSSQSSYQFAALPSGFLPWHVQATGTKQNPCHLLPGDTRPCLYLSSQSQQTKAWGVRSAASSKEKDHLLLLSSLLGKTCQGHATNSISTGVGGKSLCLSMSVLILRTHRRKTATYLIDEYYYSHLWKGKLCTNANS